MTTRRNLSVDDELSVRGSLEEWFREDGFLVEVGGGGGFWDAFERDPARVLADVRSGYVSPEAARRDYGVVIRQQGRRFELDVEATKALRQDADSAHSL